MLETLRPDPTFYPSPKLAMEAPAENYAYVLMLSPDGSQPDALGVVDVQLGSSTYGTLVHTVTMPNKGDEFRLAKRAARRRRSASPVHSTAAGTGERPEHGRRPFVLDSAVRYRADTELGTEHCPPQAL